MNISLGQAAPSAALAGRAHPCKYLTDAPWRHERVWLDGRFLTQVEEEGYFLYDVYRVRVRPAEPRAGAMKND